MGDGANTSEGSDDWAGARDDIENALLEGARTFAPGTARAALSYPTFRRVYFGALLSNIGSWMQNVVLGAYMFDLTHSATYVSYAAAAQLLPMLFLSILGGSLADRYDRRALLVLVAIEQTVFSLFIAYLTTTHAPAVALLLGATVAIGMGQAVFAPTFAALMPTLVDKRDLAGAVALNSVNMNLSRVIGPIIGSTLYATIGAPWVFVGNAASYGFIIAAVATVRLPHIARDRTEGRIQRILGGFRAARRDPIVGRCLATMVLFSFFCLPVAVMMPVVAERNLGIADKSVQYGVLYAVFGLGAVAGALSIGTFLAGQELAKVVRFGLAGFAVTLSSFALLRTPGAAFSIAFLVGYCYFTTVTSLATVLQKRLDDAVRGRVMALWVMAFGGTVPLGALVAGPVADAVGITAVLIAGAVVAGGLVFYTDLREPPVQPATR